MGLQRLIMSAQDRLFHPFRITAVRNLNAFVRLLRAEQVAKAGPRLNFRPGQWADVALGEAEVQARRQRQALDIVGVGGYSFISAPESLPTVEFAIQREAAAERIEAGGASAVSMTRWIHSADCREGVELQMRAGGRFVLEPAPGHAGDAPEKLMLVAAGIGLTPFLSFLRSSVRCGRGASTPPTRALLSHVSLLYSVRGISERGVFVDELKELVVENGMPHDLRARTPGCGEARMPCAAAQIRLHTRILHIHACMHVPIHCALLSPSPSKHMEKKQEYFGNFTREPGTTLNG